MGITTVNGVTTVSLFLVLFRRNDRPDARWAQATTRNTPEEAEEDARLMRLGVGPFGERSANFIVPAVKVVHVWQQLDEFGNQEVL